MIEILLPMIERWHCVDWVLKNIELAEKPEDIQILCVITASDKYVEYVKKKLDKIFDKVRIIRKDDFAIEHDELRRRYYSVKTNCNPDKIREEKLRSVYRTYQKIVDNVDTEADYYWFIEDDTLFPLDIYSKYMNLIRKLRADIITGVSYYWHTKENRCRNFWNLEVTRTFGEKDTSNEVALNVTPIQAQTVGIIRLGATGLGNVISKKEAVLC